MCNVLLVEDNPVDSFLFEEYLRNAAPATYTISTTDYLEKAWYLSQVISPEVVVIDLSLPDAGGEQTLKLAVQYFKNKPIVILTEWDDLAIAKKAAAEGIEYFLVKSEINGSLLNRSIQCAIERHQTAKQHPPRRLASLRRDQRPARWV